MEERGQAVNKGSTHSPPEGLGETSWGRGCRGKGAGRQVHSRPSLTTCSTLSFWKGGKRD